MKILGWAMFIVGGLAVIGFIILSIYDGTTPNALSTKIFIIMLVAGAFKGFIDLADKYFKCAEKLVKNKPKDIVICNECTAIMKVISENENSYFYKCNRCGSLKEFLKD